MNQRKGYKWCFVPECKNNNVKTPDKLFFYVPEKMDRRKQWFKVAHRTDEPGRWSYFCCEDHFNIKEDMESYVKYNLTGGPVKLKKDVVPHRFDCQINRVKTWSNLSRPAYLKLEKKRTLAKILSEAENVDEEKASMNELDHPKKTCLQRVEMVDEENVVPCSLNDCISVIPSNNQGHLSTIEQNVVLDENSYPRTDDTFQTLKSVSAALKEQNVNVINFGVAANKEESNYLKTKKVSMKSVGVQVEKRLVKPHVRSKEIMCTPSSADASSQTDMYVKSHIQKNLQINTSKSSSSYQSSSTISTLDKSSSYKPDSQSEFEPSSSCSDEKKEAKKKMKQSILTVTLYLISTDPRKYIGIASDWLWIIDKLQQETKCSVEDIKLTLMKIRTNDTFSRLGDQFGLSTSQASRVFHKTIKPIAHYLKTLICDLDSNSVKKNLPIPFRAYYSNVYTIIDAFEIEIQKPSNALHQALTWSEYKKCNTLKYIIASTPDGTINFISKGYGGRISDTLLFEESQMMKILPQGCSIMADRGFKQIQNILNEKGCKLLRPPSVSNAVKSTEKEVLTTKSIASLRIHIERVIRRVREYKILEPHSCIDLKLMPIVDNVVEIVCGLINLQKPIIKK